MLRRFLLCTGLLLVALPAAPPATADPSLFPRPPGLAPRVAFWTRIYTEVDGSAGLIHDTQNLAVVYERIALAEGLSSRARERRIDSVRDRYRGILRKLAAGKRSGLSSEEQRVLALFPPGVTNATLLKASKRIRFQLGQADKFRAGIKRMGRWEDYIRQVLRERGLPTELVALPHVESSYNPKAVSHAGASGIWQFTRSTGRRFMQVDHVVDERRDPFLASVAAARLLKQNYDSTGSWPLAITAYNHGAAGMRRAVKKLGTRDMATIVERYRSRSFGFASQNFYTEFLAALDVELDPDRWFGPIPKDLPEQPQIVVLDDFYKANSLARSFGLSLDVLREHNPALLRPVWDGQKLVPRSYGLRLPAGRRGPAPEAVLASVPAAERFTAQIQDRSYRVRRGDTLSKIARRFGVRESALMRANGVRNRNRIRVGQVLEIPGRPAPSVARAKTKRKPGPAGKKKSVAKAAPAPNRDAIPANGLYKVRRGDNLAGIARRFGVSQTDLAAANRLRNRNRIQVGQVLRIPGGSASAETVRPGVYTVRKGDTLEKIARRFGVSQSAILELNELRSRHRIQVGQRLYLPGGSAPQASKPEPAKQVARAPGPAPATEIQAPQPAPETAPLPAPTPAESPAGGPAPAAEAPGEPMPYTGERYAVSGGTSIRLQPDETLGHYADWLDVTASSLRRLNGIKSSRRLQLDQELRLDFSRVDPQGFEKRRREHHRALQSRFYGDWQVAGTREYVLRRGDTLWALANGNEGVPAWLLLAYNPGVDFAQLRAGQRVTIPRLERRS